LALAGRGEETAVTARERAATAWDVLPVVYAGVGTGAGVGGEVGLAAGDASALSGPAAAAMALSEAMMSSYVAPASFGGPGGAAGGAGAARTQRAGGRDLVAPDGGPDWNATPGSGLGGLSSRAGEALGSFVNPVAAPMAP